ncbi:MAG: serine/threonine-protein kinase [Planctomycetota bacterium]
MATATTADELAQRAMDVNVLDEGQLRAVWSDLGTRTASLEELTQLLLRKGWLTNYQIDRLTKNLRDGYFYGDYKVLYCIGSGGFARVFRTANRKTGTNYAVKVLRNRYSAPADPKAAKVADFFRREGELGKTLVHPNIVSIHEVVSRPGAHYLVMDFVEGQNLREAFRRRRRFEWKEAAEIVGDVLLGLQYAFQQGVTHRDLKMSNVLIGSDGAAKLIDFGLAALDNVAADEGADRTVEYAALEKATGVRKDDTRSDIFFAGYMLHQMLSGVSSLPSGRDRMQRFGKDTFKEIKPILEHAPDTPMPIAMALGKALELDPDRRYQTPGDMLTDLKLAIRRSESSADADGKKQELDSREGIGEDGQPRRIMVVESNTKRQDVLRDLFKRNGYRVLVTSDPRRALARFDDDATTAEVLLLCSGNIGQDAVDVFNTFASNPATRDLPAVLLLDESQKSWAPHASTDEHRSVVTMPCTLRQLRQAVADSLLTGKARAG